MKWYKLFLITRTKPVRTPLGETRAICAVAIDGMLSVDAREAVRIGMNRNPVKTNQKIVARPCETPKAIQNAMDMWEARNDAIKEFEENFG